MTAATTTKTAPSEPELVESLGSTRVGCAVVGAAVGVAVDGAGETVGVGVGFGEGWAVVGTCVGSRQQPFKVRSKGSEGSEAPAAFSATTVSTTVE